jgi:hypothetical protein
VTRTDLADLSELSLGGLSIDELTSIVQSVERLRRQCEAVLAQAVDVVDRSGEFRADGHRSVAAWGRATCNWSVADAARIARNGRAMAAGPAMAAAARAGDIGVAQLDEFGRAVANPRCRDAFAESADLLVHHARTLWYSDFRQSMARWVALADADGAHREHLEAHQQRRAGVSRVGDEVMIEGSGGVIQGETMREIFQHFVHAEFLTDWQQAQAIYGDATTPALLARTDAQRRFDALYAIFTTAAAAAPGVVSADQPLVNILADQATVELVLARAAGATVADPDPAEFGWRRCELAGGAQIDPEHLLAAVLVGQLRRVVVDSAGVVTDLGRRSRLFRRGSREAVLLGGGRCLWPGCEQPAGRCQTDHTDEWSRHAGPTRPQNGGLTCPHHNRHKSRGYTVRRDDAGRWHTYRPDGSELPTPSQEVAA